MQATRLWSLWQALTLSFAVGFTRVGHARFVQWVTGIALNVEEHTITQSLVGLGAADDWKALESFAEYGSWKLTLVQEAAALLAAAPQDQRFFGYTAWAGDDTKVHRSSKDVWGTCTFRERSGRCPNRASTVRAHNWVFTGALRRHGERPPTFLPTAGLLYFRKAQLPDPQKGPPITFRTKCQMMVELARQNANCTEGKHLLALDGGYARRSVLRPLVRPDPEDAEDAPRVDVVTRIRCDACLHAPLAGCQDRRRKWGPRLPAPRQAEGWPGPWQQGRVYVYGQWRQVRFKEVPCRWRALGHDVPVKAVAAWVEGFKEMFTLLSTALDLGGLQVVEVFGARSRQEDGIRDLKQRLGWEECRAWTRNPIERTTQVLFVALTCLRLLEEEISEEAGDGWWLHPPWNKEKDRPSVLDVQRLLWRHREAFARLSSKLVQQARFGQSQEGPGG